MKELIKEEQPRGGHDDVHTALRHAGVVSHKATVVPSDPQMSGQWGYKMKVSSGNKQRGRQAGNNGAWMSYLANRMKQSLHCCPNNKQEIVVHLV